MNKFRERVKFILFPLILFLYPLRHVMYGMEWCDTGYNYGNFVYMDGMDSMWMFSTYLANALGNLMSRLPFGDRMLGLNIYTGLLLSVLAVGSFYFLTKRLQIPSWIVFLGELLAISLCWCPTALLYNYLTYVLLGAAVLFLYEALIRDKKLYFLLAGVCLGINVFVRFSNLAQMAFILAVWAFGIICKKKWKKVAAQTGWCILGYAAGLFICFGALAIRYGAGEYLSGILQLMSMPAEASDYTVVSMVESQLRHYLQNFYWMRYLIAFTLLGILGFSVLPGKLVRLKQIGFTACVFLGFYYLRQQNMFNFTYTTKHSVFQWAAFFLSATIIIGTVTIFRKKSSEKEKLWAGLSILLVLITPLGSNNHLYSSMNNLFLAAPFTLWMLYRFLKWLPGQLWSSVKGHIRIYAFPIKAMIACMLLMLFVQSLLFGWFYVFMESGGGENLNTKVENNDILKGIYMQPERAEILSNLTEYVNSQGLKGKELILYGKIPSLSYYLEMPFVDTAWPDLASYNFQVMKENLDDLARQIERGEREKPILLLEVQYGTFLEGGAEALSQAGIGEKKIEEIGKDKKFALLLQWAEIYGYTVAYKDEKFVLLRADM